MPQPPLLCKEGKALRLNTLVIHSCPLSVAPPLICVQLACHTNNIGNFGEEELLERRAIRHWSIWRSDAANRSIEVFKSLFGNDSSQFAGKSSDSSVLVEENDFVRLSDRIENGFLVERQQRT